MALRDLRTFNLAVVNGTYQRKTKPLFGSARRAIEPPSASHAAKSPAEAELEDENEDFETLRWCLLETANDGALPGLTSSKAFKSELLNMEWAISINKASDTTDEYESDDDENIPPPSSVIYAKSKKAKFKRKRAYDSIQALTYDWEARQALEAALNSSCDSSNGLRARNTYKPGGKSQGSYWYG